ncbi:class I SAM-dependent DNA methyltransferase [Psychroserpens sp.]|uniref:class I SAM-dependent DNA methyltransferase n=1 Tax=Psychroserpens sp. TaxID=2020870 RepID=UPI001B062F41|nr:class I SAM-dependent DNA methyltransferase [Psychroserpens sp.]MBO6606718.1 SAM-dependent DNA methyltransferase [Psychroserpens sp.]MBO6630765.1 SAM-dependent DNA methyltransferase [Psychroserpens sp.]MBO6653422.1 SAM-dependent DNA methyltransferase [Psychroserpens sp.]MBO6680551.1 SAM-dependent DNA methyltransferase [Psychroserpens sp.]MBO6750491.1 SAM-dependent DNA methyltransferase [Psychroserpens sp.]
MSKKRDIDVSKEAGLIWQVANDVLRDIFQRTEYPDIIYPMVLIRRLECVLKEETESIENKFGSGISKMSKTVASKFIDDKLYSSVGFINTSGFTLQGLKDEGEKSIKNNFISYLNGFHSKRAKKDDPDQIQDVIKYSGIRKHIDKLNSNDILYSVIEEFANIQLEPRTVSNIKMGYIFEELIRRFSEANNSEAGEHYTPREVIDLMTHLLDIDERKLKDGELVTIYDPACGTGGMLTALKEFIETNVNDKANVRLYGQEVNDKTWSICEADLMIKGEDAKVVNGDTLFEDGFPNEKFDYMISNPPYGKSWSKIKKKVMANSNGRFDIGQPRSSDGQLLFTLHMLSKMKDPKKGGSSIAIVHNGSPLFSGDAGGGESTIRKHIIENDWLETIIALPTQLFYNTGIATYVWIVRNNKPDKRKGKIQLINAVDFWKPMKRSLGDKRRYIADKDVERIVQIHKDFKTTKYSKIYDLDDFAYRKVFLELEELDESGNQLYEKKEVTVAQNALTKILEATPEQIKKLKDKKSTEPDAFAFELKSESDFIEKYKTPDKEIIVSKKVDGNKLKLTAIINVPVIVKDTEIIPWKDDMSQWLNKEVEKKWTFISEKKGYEIPFTREFYVYQPLRKLETVLQEFKDLENGNMDKDIKGNTQLLNELGLQL